METKNHISEEERYEIKFEGNLEGIREGVMQGFPKGYKNGIQQAEIKKEAEFIRNMLAKGCSLEFISKISGKSVEDLSVF